MRKLIVSANITLDGYMAGRQGELDWHFPFWTDEMSAYACRQLRTADTIIVGRHTYQKMAAWWPYAPHSDFAQMMNSYEKIVCSTSLKKVSWRHSRLLSENIGEEITRLKKTDGRDMIIYGSASLVQSFAPLVDEYQVWLHPVAIG
ncbi:MAG: dihydrofolate reductase family protein, partial [Bacteroidetes bacterium]|nr:dihydrofolate reductase family protein [Bacteroidota bacterium]